MASSEEKLKNKLYMREWRKKHPDVGAAYMRKFRDENPYYKQAAWNKWAEHQKKYKRQLRDIVNIHKSRPCMDCGVQYNPWVMDLDHRNPEEKVASVTRLISDGSQKQIVLDEIAKCDVVCSNCHRERTYKNIWLKQSQLGR